MEESKLPTNIPVMFKEMVAKLPHDKNTNSFVFQSRFTRKVAIEEYIKRINFCNPGLIKYLEQKKSKET